MQDDYSPADVLNNIVRRGRFATEKRHGKERGGETNSSME